MNNAQVKTERIRAVLERREPDRVPVGEFFWTSFIRRAKQEGHVPADFDPYRYWDLDKVVVTPNMDPRLTGIEVLEEAESRQVVRTGFGATIEVHRSCPMPLYRGFETQTFEQMEALRFDDAGDERRYLGALDDQLNSVGDVLNLGLPA